MIILQLIRYIEHNKLCAINIYNLTQKTAFLLACLIVSLYIIAQAYRRNYPYANTAIIKSANGIADYVSINHTKTLTNTNYFFSYTQINQNSYISMDIGCSAVFCIVKNILLCIYYWSKRFLQLDIIKKLFIIKIPCE